jgi:hypothetical protein
LKAFFGICMITCYKNVACGSVSVPGDSVVSHSQGNNKIVTIKLRSECWASLINYTKWQMLNNYASGNRYLQDW